MFSVSKLKTNKGEKMVVVNDKSKNIENKTYDIKHLTSLAIIETVLVVIMSLYLCFFYATATYSAFFKDVETLGTKITSTFLEPTAISAAWKQGLGIGLFVTLFPFIFVSLGYFIFHNNKNNKYLAIGKAISILSIVFIYDVLIAYIITENIFKQHISFDGNTIFNWNICLKEQHFWLIIGAGFIVYLIFGFICNSASKKWAILTNIKIK